MATNPFTKILSSRQAEADKHQAAEKHAAEAAPTVTRSAASAALAHASEARAEQQAQAALRDGDDSHAKHTPDNTPTPAHDATNQPGGSQDGGNPNHPFNANLNAELNAAEATAHGDLQRLIDTFGHAPGDPTGGAPAHQSPEDRLHQGGGGPDPRQSTRDAASDPEDHGKGGDAFAALQGDLRSQVTGHHGEDAMTSALEGLVTDAATHDTSPLNVAADGPLANAVNSVTPADVAAEAAKNGVTPPSSSSSSSSSSGSAPASGSAPSTAPATGSHPSSGDNVPEPGFFTTLAANGLGAAVRELISAPVSAAAEHEAKAADRASGGTGRNQGATTTVAGAEHDLGIKNLESGFIPSGGKTAGGGAKLTDPNRDPDQGGKPTDAQLAFIHALNEATHTGPAFHNPGFVDPGRDGDQSGLATGPASAGTIAANTGVAGEHAKLGDPGNPNAGGETAAGNGTFHSGPVPTPGHGGGEPGDAQSGVVRDDGNSTHGTVHETGPGNEHFGPSDSLGATRPSGSSSDQSSTGSSDGTDSSSHLTLNPALLAELEQHHLSGLVPVQKDDD